MKSKHPMPLLFFAFICWITLVLQFIIILQNRIGSVGEAVIRFFTFFTILTNLLVATTLLVGYLKPKKKFSFFSKSNTQTAIAVYIFVVGFVYNIILRSLWQPQGLHKIVDEMLHTVIPIGYVTYWFFYTNKQTITWKNCFRWLIYPLVYLIVILILGSFSKYYPYPFVDVIVLGFEKVLFNSIFLTLFFVFVSFLFVGVAKLKTRKEI